MVPAAPAPVTPEAAVTTLALRQMNVDTPELLHGLLSVQTEAELVNVQVLLRGTGRIYQSGVAFDIHADADDHAWSGAFFRGHILLALPDRANGSGNLGDL